MLGGVASGLAYHSGIDVRLVRLLFLMAAMFSFGLAVFGYLAAWVLLPVAAPDSPLAQRRKRRRLSGRQVAFVLMGFGAAMMLGIAGAQLKLLTAVAFVALGVWLLVREKDDVEDEMPYPFAGDGDVVSTTPEYERYIANRAKRLEQQQVRRNRNIAIAAAASGVVLIGLLGGTFLDPSEPSGMEIEAPADLSTAPIPVAGDEVGIDGADETQYIFDSTVQLQPGRVSAVTDRRYEVVNGTFELDLTSTFLDQPAAITVAANNSTVNMRLPADAPVEVSTMLSDSSFSTEGRRHASVDGVGLSIELIASDSTGQIEWVEP